MKAFLIIYVTGFVLSINSCGQINAPKNSTMKTSDQQVGGGCEGCEAWNEMQVPFKDLKSSIVLPDYNEPGSKIKISGTIYTLDGKTPAANVVLYVYHTDQSGKYSVKGNETGWGKRHGYIRGWLKTNARGEYTFYTLRPAAYPGGKAAAHIHATIKEPGKSAYWIDEFVFADDLNVDSMYRATMPARGGSGILSPLKANNIYTVRRNIILGMNIPAYTLQNLPPSSGLEVGSNCPAFDPLHISGADAGKHVCPMCKYGYGEGILIWINNLSVASLSSFSMLLESEVQKRGLKNLRVFMIFMKPANESMENAKKKLNAWTRQINIRYLAITLVPSNTDAKTAVIYKINPDTAIANTVLIYKQRVVSNKFINLPYDQEGLQKIMDNFNL